MGHLRTKKLRTLSNLRHRSTSIPGISPSLTPFTWDVEVWKSVLVKSWSRGVEWWSRGVVQCRAVTQSRSTNSGISYISCMLSMHDTHKPTLHDGPMVHGSNWFPVSFINLSVCLSVCLSLIAYMSLYHTIIHCTVHIVCLTVLPRGSPP